MFNTRFRGKNCAIAGQEYYLGKVRIRLFVPNRKLGFGSHLWDATVDYWRCEAIDFGRCKQSR